MKISWLFISKTVQLLGYNLQATLKLQNKKCALTLCFEIAMVKFHPDISVLLQFSPELQFSPVDATLLTSI